MDQLERFSWFVDDPQIEGACHEWVGGKSKGYGKFYPSGDRRGMTATRWLLGNLRGQPLGPDEQVLHDCDNPGCVNPEHLYVGTPADNMRDMSDRGRNPVVEDRRSRTHCVNGHPYSEANTIIRRNGNRACYACQRAATRRWRASKMIGA